jgi:hypothetical protein
MVRLAGGVTSETVLGYLKDIRFPAKKDDLIHAARRNGVPDDFVGALGQLPVKEVGSPQEFNAAYAQLQ